MGKFVFSVSHFVYFIIICRKCVYVGVTVVYSLKLSFQFVYIWPFMVSVLFGELLICLSLFIIEHKISHYSGIDFGILLCKCTKIHLRVHKANHTINVITTTIFCVLLCGIPAHLNQGSILIILFYIFLNGVSRSGSSCLYLLPPSTSIKQTLQWYRSKIKGKDDGNKIHTMLSRQCSIVHFVYIRP